MKILAKFNLGLMSVLLGICLFIYWGGPRLQKSQYLKSIHERAASIAAMSAYSVAPALFFDDPKTIDEVLLSARQNEDLVYAVVRSSDGKVAAAWEPEAAERAGYAETPAPDITPDKRTLNVRIPVEFRGQVLGDLSFGFSLEAMHRGTKRVRTALFFVSLILFGVAAAVSFLLTTTITGPLRRVIRAAGEIAAGDLSRRADVRSRDEVGALARSFNIMVDHLGRTQGELAQAKVSLEARVEERTRELHGLIGELERRNRDLGLLGELGDAFQTCQTQKEIYEVARRYAVQIFPGLAGAIFLFVESRDFLSRIFDWGGMPGEPSFFAPTECWALRRSKTHVFLDPGADLICPHMDGGRPPRPYLCMPLVALGETLGILNLWCGEESETAAGKAKDELGCDMTVQIAQNFVLRIAMAMANLRLREELRQQSIRDPLTGLFNRRYMEETLDRELFRAGRSGTNLAVLMLDIDFFKQFNDAHGHDAGDLMLRALGRLLQSSIRRGDVACRYGGEEFVIIMPGASADIARERAAKILEDANGTKVEYLGWSLGGISLSIGVSAIPGRSRTGAELLTEADRALLKAKREGRGRVVVSAE